MTFTVAYASGPILSRVNARPYRGGDVFYFKTVKFISPGDYELRFQAGSWEHVHNVKVRVKGYESVPLVKHWASIEAMSRPKKRRKMYQPRRLSPSNPHPRSFCALPATVHCCFCIARVCRISQRGVNW